jgi:hypothetical protein
MSARRLLSCAALIALSWATPIWAAGPPLEFAVRRPHLIGASHGTLVFTDESVEYKTTDENDARHWTYEQIKQVQVQSPTLIAVRTYEDQGWTKLWADRTFEFEIETGVVTPELSALLLAKIPRPVVTAVLPPLAGTPRYEVPVKHVRGRRGSEGELLLYDNALVYRSTQPDASRYWRFTDLASVYAPDRYRLDLITYEGGGGDTRPFSFQLKTDLPAGFYDTLWSAINPLAPLRGGTQSSSPLAPPGRRNRS